MEATPDSFGKINRILVCLVTMAVLAMTVYVRIRLAGVPLERDEGEYAYMGQLLLKGIPPYASAYTMKLPGTAMMYALFMGIFGQTPTGIHTGFLLVNTASAVLVYLLGRRIFNVETGLTAGAFYLVLSLSESVLGVFAHATHLVVLFSLAGILLLWHALEKEKPLWILVAGSCFGASVLMKQHAVLLVLFALVCLVWPRRRDNRRSLLKDSSLLLAGAALPYCFLILWLIQSGVFIRFWFWTVQYASGYASEQSFAAAMIELKRQGAAIAKTTLPIYILAGAGMIILCRRKGPGVKRHILIGYFMASVIMICPGFYFRAHYFVLLLPSIALLAALATFSTIPGRLPSPFKTSVPSLLLLVLAAYSFAAEKAYDFTLQPEEVSRKIYETNPFPEAVKIAAYIKSQTTSKDCIAVLGSEPEILFYADRLSATGHIYMYGLMEVQKHAELMQRQLISEIEKAAPAFIVVVGSPMSWLPRPNSLNEVLLWGDSYIPLRYDEVGIVEIFGDQPSRYVWGEQVNGYETSAPSYVSIFKKRQ